MVRNIDILMFVEDPSAANYAALLLPEFGRQGWRTKLFASAVACSWLQSRGVAFNEIVAGSDALSLLREINPRCVLVGTAENPDTLGLHLIDAAQIVGIPSMAFIDALMGAEYRFCGAGVDPLAHAPDWLLVPDGMTFDAFVGLGYPLERIAVCGHPQYDQTRALAMQWEGEGGPELFRKRLFPDVDSKKRILTFVSEGAARYGQLQRRSSNEYGYSGRGVNKGRTKIILEEVLDAVSELAERPYVVFRAHPIESTDEYAEYRTEIDYFSSRGLPLELVYASDLTVGMTSMLLLEAVLLGRPSLAVLAHATEVDLLPSVRNGLTPHVLNRHDLRKLLPNLLCADSVMDARSEEGMMVENAAVRVTRALSSIISRGQNLTRYPAQSRAGRDKV
jgi:hypothetical protein